MMTSLIASTKIKAASSLLASLLGSWGLTGAECSSGAVPDLSQVPAFQKATMTVDADSIRVHLEFIDESALCTIDGRGTYSLKGDEFTPDFPSLDVTCDGQTDSMSAGAVQTIATITDDQLRLATAVEGLNACPAKDKLILVLNRL